MISRHALHLGLTVSLLAAIAGPGRAAEPVKVVIVAGSNFYQVGEHDYLAGSAALMNLLRQTPGVVPVLAVNWPEKPEETFAGARAVVLFCDGGDKHPFLKGDRLDRIEKLSAAGVGLVALHQVDDVPKDLGDRTRLLLGAAWEKGFSQRAHWVTTFSTFPDHPVTRGVKPFTIDDGWLYQLRFVPELAGVSPLLRTAPPKAPAPPTPAGRSSPGLTTAPAAAVPSSSRAGTSTRAWPRKDTGGSWSTASSGRPASRSPRRAPPSPSLPAT